MYQYHNMDPQQNDQPSTFAVSNFSPAFNAIEEPMSGHGLNSEDQKTYFGTDSSAGIDLHADFDTYSQAALSVVGSSTIDDNSWPWVGNAEHMVRIRMRSKLEGNSEVDHAHLKMKMRKRFNPGQTSKLKENEFIQVKARGPQPQGNSEEVEKIPKEEAICRFCFDVYQDNMLQTKCKCKFVMIHQTCEVEWTKKKGNDKCEVCEQDIQNIPITVSMDHLSSTPTIDDRKRKKFGCF
ncbi:hypothetical protein ACP275_07G088000 [Erythranthe tilingii]